MNDKENENGFLKNKLKDLDNHCKDSQENFMLDNLELKQRIELVIKENNELRKFTEQKIREIEILKLKIRELESAYENNLNEKIKKKVKF